MKEIKLIGMSAILLISSVLGVGAQNLLQNGSFELPGFGGNQMFVAYSTELTGWVVGGNGSVYVHNGMGGIFAPAQDGSHYLDLSGDGVPHGTLFQEFATIPGLQYDLNFYIGSSANSDPTINVQLIGVNSILNTTLTPLVPTGNINWTEESFLFTADSSITRLSFVDVSVTDDNSSYVDNVSVTVVPEPMALLPIGLIALFFFRRR